MAEPFLTHPVVTLDKELLFPAGIELSPDKVDEIAGSSKTKKWIKLNRFDSVENDILELVRTPPYNSVFRKDMELTWLLKDMSESDFPINILETLKYFKENDYSTYRHQLMVFALSGLVARDLMPDRGNIIRLSMAGPVHDIGKICTPLHILKKETPLTLDERGILDNHSAAGYVLMSYYGREQQSIGSIAARDHHERRDGSGKPTGKRLQNRLVEIIAVCDIYDALISPRPYRPVSYDNRSAIEKLVEMADSGTISMDIVRIIVAHNRKERPCNLHCEISREKRGTVPEGNIYGVTAE
jgi:HD-GYP domain-containing protein (c-di-GMP phosphodiesterase class II)